MRLKEFLKKGGETNPSEDWDKMPVSRKVNYIKGFLTQKGYTTNQTAAILGNLLQENSTLGTSVQNSSSGAIGIAQWHKDRKTELLQKSNPYNIITQLNHLDSELKGSKHWTNNMGGKNAFFKSDDVDYLTKVIRKDFERPGEAEANDNARLKNAYSVLGQTYTSSNSDNYSEQYNPQYANPADYTQAFQDMQKGLWDSPNIQKSYEQAPDFTKMMMDNINIQKDLEQTQRLEQERQQQEQNKKIQEQQNAQYEQMFKQDQEEKQQFLDMIPQSKAIPLGQI